MRMRTAALILASALLAAGCGEKDEPEPQPAEWEGETIQLGSIFSTTGIGKVVGPQQVEAVELAVEQVNEEGGVNGAEIAVEQIDDNSDPGASVDAMETLINEDEVLAVLGPTFSNSAAEADPVADKLGTPVLAVSNTGPGIVGDCPYPCELVFRDSLGEEDAIPANVGNYAESSDAKTAVVVFPLDDPFGESTAAIAEEAFKENGIDVASVEHFAPLEAGPLPAIEAAIKEKADVIFVTTSSGEVAATTIKIAREAGFKGDILGGNALNISTAAEQAGADGKGARSAAGWYAGSDSEANTAFVEAYRDSSGSNPDQFAAQAYSGLKLLAAAAESADLGFSDVDADRAALAESLAAVDIITPLGQFSFTEDHDVSQPIWIVEMNGDGGYELVTQLPAE